MNNPNFWGNRHDDRLGVNKIGKNIRKSPPLQPNTNISGPQPQVYNINKNDFRSVVQQLTGSPSRHSQQPPNPPTNRLQRIRPPKLEPINLNRPQIPPRGSGAGAGAVRYANNNNYYNPRPNGQQPPPMHTAESPISAYMRHLQHSIIDTTQQHPQTHHFPSPRLATPPPFPSPRMAGPSLMSPRLNAPFLSPTAISPSGYMNLLSPLSPYPLLSPAYQHPMPLNPVFSFSPMAQTPASPGIGFPSPGFFNIPSPRWRN